MKNKVLVKIVVPELDTCFDVFLPVNEWVWKVKKLLIKSISDLTSMTFEKDIDFVLINKDTSQIYKDNEIIIQTDIRNGSEILFLSKR